MPEFILLDSRGNAHRYDVTLHRGSEGQMLALRLSALLLEPLAEAVGPVVLGSLEGVMQAVEGGDNAGKKVLAAILDDPAILASIDASAVGRAAASSLRAIDEASIFNLLRYTNRDGEPLIDGRSGRPTVTYDTAYAGNYMELGRALWQVAQVNGFFPALGTSGGASKKASSRAPAQPGSIA